MLGTKLSTMTTGRLEGVRLSAFRAWTLCEAPARTWRGVRRTALDCQLVKRQHASLSAAGLGDRRNNGANPESVVSP